MQFNQTPWWMSDTYDDDSDTGGIDLNDTGLFGPNGAALIQLLGEGKTAPGWGRDTFMAKYNNLSFAPNKILRGYHNNRWEYAWIMRGARLVCIDIDGKNTGFDHASELGWLPPTTAETSKSGNGYHLFYTVEDEWDPQDGFQTYRDHIGIVTGIDVRGTGCVYHYRAQRWNNRPPAPLPQHLVQMLQEKRQRQLNQRAVIQKTLELDPEEIAMMHADLIDELAKPIPNGKRNNTLFAIGSKMKEAEVPDWDVLVRERAQDVGLDDLEIDKMIKNIDNYA